MATAALDDTLNPSQAFDPGRRDSSQRPANPLVERFQALPARTRMALAVAIPALLALIVTGFLQLRTPDYQVLFANLSDADGGAITAALQQQGIPYQLGPGGQSILVPAERVHDTRLSLATQGLPRGGNVGFELMDRAPLGITQFQEQVNYQRALEGELARSIQSLGVVQAARVHLAVPRPSVFVRESNQPTASVLVQMLPGRSLDPNQIAGIVHLVSSSVPQLTDSNVTVVDQNGNLLSSQSGSQGALDATQLEFKARLEAQYTQRIRELLAPIVGSNNLRSQVSIDLDFSQVETTEETFRPNTDPEQAAIRSRQTTENISPVPLDPQGVPGALSNTPPGVAVAPVQGDVATNPAAQGVQTLRLEPGVIPLATQRADTTNYEVDKRVTYTREPTARVRRIAAAVVVNHRSVTAADGTVSLQPLEPEQIARIEQIVRDAVGAREDREDAISVVNLPFEAPAEPEITVPLWQQPEIMALAQSALGWLVLLLLGLYLIFGIIRPAVRQMTQPKESESAGQTAGALGAGGGSSDPFAMDASSDGSPSGPSAAELMLERARTMAKENPRMVAQVLKNWLSAQEAAKA